MIKIEKAINKVILGDSLKVIKKFPDKSVDCVITSPPYYRLRDYNFKEQWGMEEDYKDFLNNLWLLMDEIWRVLKDDGTVWINLGDTYMNNSSYSTKGRQGFGKDKERLINKKDDKIRKKSLMMIPQRFSIGCIDRGWILRNNIIWASTNKMPESVTDRFSKKHEFVFFFVKQPKYYFDLDSIRDEPIYKNDSNNRESRWSKNYKGLNHNHNIKGNMTKDGLSRTTAGLNLKKPHEKIHPKGKNPGDVSDFWNIPTRPNKNKHYATFNTDLIEKPIVSGCPKDGIILDPFCGSGTTLVAGLKLGRKVIGIDGNREYCRLSQKSINEFLLDN